MTEQVAEREGFKSRMGFILVSAGCAIGIGNVWRFPYIVGQGGGAIFVLLYLVFLVLIGVPALTMELAVGRAGGMTTMRAMMKLEKSGQCWHLHGWVGYAGSVLLMMYYTTVCGWMFSYFWRFMTGRFEGMDAEGGGAEFDSLLADPKEMLIFTGITTTLGFLVLSFGVQKGLERVTKIMMIGLLSLIVVLAVNSLTLKGAGEGIRFYLMPDVEKAAEIGWNNVIFNAMTQAFFTISIGIGCMEIFGSYMTREYTLTGEAIRIVSLDTFVAVMAGLIIFPACSAFGVEADQGPALIFQTLPRIFLNMHGGRLWGMLFFLFMIFASFSTVTAVFEGQVRTLMDNLGWKRQKSIIVNLLLILVLSIPCVLGFNQWSGLHPIGDRNVLESEDFIVSNLLLPLGSLVFVLFCSWRFGWGAEECFEEINTGKGIRMSKRLIPYFKYVLPFITVYILIRGLL